jgi:hypothetical protein
MVWKRFTPGRQLTARWSSVEARDEKLSSQEAPGFVEDVDLIV